MTDTFSNNSEHVTALEEVNARIMLATPGDVNESGGEQRPGDVVLGIASDFIRRVRVAMTTIAEEITPIAAQANASAERIYQQLSHVRSPSEYDAAIAADASLKALHEECMRLRSAIIPLQGIQTILTGLLTIEIQKLYPETMDKEGLSAIRITPDWHLCLVRPQIPVSMVQDTGPVQVFVVSENDPDDMPAMPRTAAKPSRLQ